MFESAFEVDLYLRELTEFVLVERRFSEYSTLNLTTKICSFGADFPKARSVFNLISIRHIYSPENNVSVTSMAIFFHVTKVRICNSEPKITFFFLVNPVSRNS